MAVFPPWISSTDRLAGMALSRTNFAAVMSPCFAFSTTARRTASTSCSRYPWARLVIWVSASSLRSVDLLREPLGRPGLRFSVGWVAGRLTTFSTSRAGTEVANPLPRASRWQPARLLATGAKPRHADARGETAESSADHPGLVLEPLAPLRGLAGAFRRGRQLFHLSADTPFLSGSTGHGVYTPRFAVEWGRGWPGWGPPVGHRAPPPLLMRIYACPYVLGV